MFVKLIIFVAVVLCSVDGHPVEVFKPRYDSKYFLDSRIVGGVDAPEGYGKHMAALVFGYQWASLICGGSIISRRHILTAAHCIEPMVTWNQELIPSFRAIIGTKKWSTGTNEVKFSDHVMHSEWNWVTIKYDIGLLTAAEDIQTSDTVAIIPLKFDWVDGGAKSYVTGWGLISRIFDLPENLQLLYVWTLSHKECEEHMRKATENLGPAPPIQADIEVCTLHSFGHGMCNGDSGSALVLEETQVQIGIVSWGFPCARGVPDVFVRVSGFEDWLRSNTHGHLA